VAGRRRARLADRRRPGAANQSISYLSLGLFLGRDATPNPLFASFTVRWLEIVLDRLPAAEARMAAWPP
jgi:hypothetical protein